MNLMKLRKSRLDKLKYAKHILIDWYLTTFNGNQPPILLDFRNQEGGIVFSDPDMVNDIYITKNKYFDKHPRSKKVLQVLVGESILFAKSDELWAKKRKNLSAAFYKDKMT